MTPQIRGFLCHFLLTLRLNFASKRPLIYGYLVPVFFLIAFGAVFRSGTPPLLHQMGQLVTISALGGTCFGMPTALVAERERGWWRRYRLLPRALAPLVASTLLVRFVLIASAALLQIALARLIYGTPLPLHPIHFAAGYFAVAFSFLGMGLLLAALAKDVPSVQALGQSVFLPLIMIGGVGIPLVALPRWTQCVAAFLPGRYAVDAIGAGYTDEGHGMLFRFNLLALIAFGSAAGIAGARLFRWDAAPRTRRLAGLWTAAAIIPWIAIGLIAICTGRWRPPPPVPQDPAQSITDAAIAGITYDGLPPDDGTVVPLAPPGGELNADQRTRLDELAARLETWPAGHVPNPSQAIRNLLCVAAVSDIDEDPLEGSIARIVFDYLFEHFSTDGLQRGLAWVILAPDAGTVLGAVPELDIQGDFDPTEIRVRCQIYATKFLGRLRGRLHD